jgi:CheY-like chemotaxis protein
MNTILSRDRSGARGQILFIEPDVRRAAALGDILRQHDGIDVAIVESVPAALRSLAVRIPDLVLTSTFLPPADEAALTAHLNQLPAARHLQTITVPYFIDAEEGSRSETSSAKVLTFLRRRVASVRPRCDLGTLRNQIEEYLSRAQASRLEADGRPLIDAPRAQDGASVQQERTREVSRPQLSPMTGVLTPVAGRGAEFRRSPSGMPADRRSARRRARGDVPWLWSVKFPGGSQVSVVDISTTGVLLETASRMTDGSTVDLQLVGQDTNVTVPARMIRVQVADVNGLGVKYRVAAAFAHDVALPGLQPVAASPVMPRMLADLLRRVLSEADHGSDAAALRATFEQELRQLLPVRDIQIRQKPVIAERGAESIYFTVPHGSGAQPILQAIFEPDYAPTAMDFRLLKAAASLAAVVLEFAPRPSNHVSPSG